ncbi:hypothetical protein LEP1GSC188_4742 [Leptospira weilii serovar Topaz str. LT2116]|uniref:Uncharacterized protein n=1 Tax=Leptospira weilii serovar Topaz str. LT2116 TaxID=1088540 RepID=M3G8G8_9LEPT|nr:hypothetical protein LEP1GSC188_4742 [Leptospira weilii serovar Topaz str. LT2116]
MWICFCFFEYSLRERSFGPPSFEFFLSYEIKRKVLFENGVELF